MTDFAARVQQITAQQFDIDPEALSLTTRFVDDLGATSLDIVELAMTIEQEFAVEVRDEDAEAIKTIGDAVTFIENAAK
jgi:acyl carrier protein